jgi:hypothetical protein
MKAPQVNTLNIASVQTALKSYRDSIGKVTLSRHYINEIRLIHYAVVGNSKPPCDLKSLPREKLHLARRAACENIKLINLHVSYEERKQACRELVLKYEVKLLK